MERASDFVRGKAPFWSLSPNNYFDFSVFFHEAACHRPTHSRSDAACATVSHRHFLEIQPITPHILPLC